MSKNLIDQVGFLHRHCPQGKEWSGLLIYQLTEGSIDDLMTENESKIELWAHGLYPMDYGDATFTSFEGNESWLKAFEKYPEIDPFNPTPGWYVGKIHSHHSMSTFHSGTDKKDLYDTAPKLPIFLSLIVNYACTTDCELAIAIEKEQKVLTKSSWKLKTWKSHQKQKNELKTVKVQDTYVVKCNVFYEHDVTQEDEWLYDVCEALKKAYHKPAYSAPYEYKPPVQTLDFSTKIKDKEPSTFTGLPLTVKNKVVNALADLFTLGVQPKIVPFLGFVRATYALSSSEYETYYKAFKEYFYEWYETSFYNVQVTENEALTEVQAFLNYHKEKPLYAGLTKAINELKESKKSKAGTFELRSI